MAASSGPRGEGKAATGEAGSDAENGGTAPKLAFELPRMVARQRLHLDFSSTGSLDNRTAQSAIDVDGRRFRLALGRPDAEAIDRAPPSDASGRSQKGGGVGRDGLPSLAQLTPSLVELQRVTGMPSNDYLPEVETDAETRLNAWQWMHATFFNRVKDGIRAAWQGPEVVQKHDPRGNIYGTHGLHTVLAVTIDGDGRVVSVNVAESSGADFYDEEAVRTFYAAGPFTHPPAELFGDSDRFTFTFGFNFAYAHQNFDFDWRPY